MAIIAQANGFARVVLDAPRVPEPASGLLVSAGIAILALGSRRSASRGGGLRDHRAADQKAMEARSPATKALPESCVAPGSRISCKSGASASQGVSWH